MILINRIEIRHIIKMTLLEGFIFQVYLRKPVRHIYYLQRF